MSEPPPADSRTFRAAHWRAVLALPFNVLVIVPALLAHFSGAWQVAGLADPQLWLALPCFAVGLALMATTIHLFAAAGRGTLAPWNPPERLVVVGPYRYVRNPMISGVLFNLAGESLLLQSWPIGAWFATFFALNAAYIPLSEEPGLRRRFGVAYERYAAAVPRWIPRLRPYAG